MITPIKQGDPRWSDKRIGNSAVTVGSDGCTISSCCMALEKLRGYFCNPKNAAYYWAFNGRGEIYWKATNFKGMKFVWRGYYPDRDKVKEYANSSDKAVILELDHGAHWVYLEKVEGSTFYIIDPWTGRRQKGLNGRKFTGYAIFEKDETIPEWQLPFIKKAKDRGLNVDSPLDTLSIQKLEKVLHDMKLIEKVEGQITFGRWLVIMDKIKELW